MVYGKPGVDFISTSEKLYQKTNVRLRLIAHNFHMFGNNPSVRRRIVDCSPCTRRIALEDGCHMKIMDMLEYTPVEFNCLETQAKTSTTPAGQNQFLQENFLNNAPVRRIDIAMNTNCAITVVYSGSRFWYQRIDLRQIRIQWRSAIGGLRCC